MIDEFNERRIEIGVDAREAFHSYLARSETQLLVRYAAVQADRALVTILDTSVSCLLIKTKSSALNLKYKIRFNYLCLFLAFFVTLN